MVKARREKPQPKQEKQEKPGLSSFIKKHKHQKTKKDKNTYQFVGFHERLKNIDVKASHASLIDQSFLYDHLQREGEQDLSQSNFISIIKQEKVNNCTLEFRRVWKELEPLAYSFPLVVINRSKLVSRLVQQLQDDTLKTIYPAILELVVALIKDLRQDIYLDFMHELLPTVISVLDCDDLPLLDSVFSLLSFSFKYLLNSIRDDLVRFYSIYVELLQHKNKFVRKFAAQSFSYVLRKVKFTPQITSMICQVKEENEIMGAVELLFEVCSGEQDSLHSKAPEVLSSIFSLEAFIRTREGSLLVRYLYLKLVNTIDINKQLALFQVMTQSLDYVTLISAVINDTVKLKFGRRVSDELGALLLKQMSSLAKSVSVQDQILLSESLSFLYYFHYDKCKDAKLFTSQLYTLSAEAVQAFFKILLVNASQITTDSDLPVSKLLDIKSTSQKVEFSQDSHKEKCYFMVPSLNKYTLKHLSIDNLSLLVSLIDISQREVKIEVAGNAVGALTSLIQRTTNQLDLYLLSKFLYKVKDNQQFVKLIESQQHLDKSIEFHVQVDSIILQNYNLDSQKMIESCATLFDLHNQGYKFQLYSAISYYAHKDLKLTVNTAESLFTLRKLIERGDKLQSDIQIQKKLAQNLSKNSRELRIATLKVLMLHDTLDYVSPAKDNKLDANTIKQYYTGHCPILSLILKAEECPLSMDTEKTKSNLMRKVQTVLSTGLVPEFYLDVCYRYSVGCLWVKFLVLYQPAWDILQEVFKQHKQYIKLHIELIQQLGYLLQLGEDNDQIVSVLRAYVKLETVEPTTEPAKLLLRDICAEQDFVQTKEFYNSLIKAIHPCVDSVFSDSELRTQLMNCYFEFMDCEYNNCIRRANNELDFTATLMASNRMDSQEFKAAKKTGYSKLMSFYELFAKSSALNKLSVTQSETLISQYLQNLQSADDVLQKHILAGLLRVSKKHDFNNKTVKLPKYQKLLEGLCDDIKFKDMILVITHGSQVEHEGQIAEEEDKKQKKSTESIPKLAEEDRLEVLPVIIKLLLSKLLKKKGIVNKKSLMQRRTIIFQFISGLDPITEFPLFFKELLTPLGLDLTNLDLKELKQHLTQVSFSNCIQFIGSAEVIFAQLGSLLNRDSSLISLTNILVLMLAQAKSFIGHLNEDQVDGEGLYQFVQRQCRMCVRKGLKILKQLYSKFGYLQTYAAHLSDLFYIELVQDQVPLFAAQYISEKAQLIELLTTHWSAFTQDNYLKYPLVLPALMQMLKTGNKLEPQVASLHLAMIKNLIVASIDSDADRLRFIQATKNDEDVDMQSDSDERDQENPEVKYSLVARQVLKTNIGVICEGLYAFWTSHAGKLKQALLGSRRQGQPSGQQSKQQVQESIALTNAVRDLTFIMSELASYIGKDSGLVHSKQHLNIVGFLEMMVGLVAQKHLLQAVSSFQQKSRLEELLMFGITAITHLLTPETDQRIHERISEMFLQMKSKKCRELLAQGIDSCRQSQISAILVSLNTVKKGQADVDYDYDKVLNGLQLVTKLPQTPNADYNVLLFSILSLLQHQEYSVREYALLALSNLLPCLDERLFKLTETHLVQNFKTTRDEMVLKSILLALRVLVVDSQGRDFASMSQALRPLLNDDHDDFFVQILSMQLPQRLKSLRKLQTVAIQPNTMNRAILPLVDYLIFDMKNQQENRRNTIRYSRDQSNQLQEEALSVYTCYASKLSWGQYMALVRKMLYKLSKATRAQNGVAAQKQDSLNEKIICKCLCKVLDGFNFPDVPDAVEALKKKVEDTVAHKYEVVEYSDFLKDMVGTTLDGIDEPEQLSSEDEDNVEMISDKVEDIQQKLHKKVLPSLSRHILQTKGENSTIRAFVAVSIAKVIRKLPVDLFSLHLQKLINLIVVKGLREKDLNTREKARKSLLKVIDEVSPRFLTLILQEMGNNLTRGFQLHVYLYTVHYVFNYMKEQMVSGQITTQMIHLISPLLLREMFGDLMEERKAADETTKKHIKESKAKKAMPVYEVFAQFIDFKTSFLDLVQPIVKVLEDNPSHSAIQQTEDLLARIANAVLKNTSITSAQLLPFMKQIIERGVSMSMRLKINDEKAKRDYGAKPNADYVSKSKAQLKLETHEVQIKWTKTSELASDRKTQEICGRVLANFGLQTFKKALNMKGFVLSGDEQQDRSSKVVRVQSELVQMLDPFVQPLLDSFKTFYNPIVVQTLQIVALIIHLGLPSFKTLLRKFINRIFKLFTTNTSADNDFANSLFKCTSELLRTYSVYSDLSVTQLQTLVQIIKANLQNFSTQSSVFTCLKVILTRRFQSADLYDLMTNVQDMMVTSVQQSTRHTCAQIFITFVLEYPMEERRLEQHIQHLLKNLTYFDAEGRQQLLETLQIIVDKMPEQKLSTWQDLIFLTLFLRLVNEASTKCRDTVTLILTKIVAKSSKRYVETVFQMKDDSEVLVNGKLQLLAIIADCGKLQKQDIRSTLIFLDRILESAAEKACQRQEVQSDSEPEDETGFMKEIGLESEASEPEEPEDKWTNAYFATRCLENLFTKCHSSVHALKEHKKIKQNIVTLMWRSQNYWVRLSCLRVINFVIKETGVQSVDSGDSLKLAYRLLGCYKFVFVSEQLCSLIEANLSIVLKAISQENLVKVFKKSSYIGRRVLGEKTDQSELKEISILQFYRECLPYLQQVQQLDTCYGAMLEFVYRAYTDEQLPAAVRDLATELVDKMSELLDKDVFLKIFNQTQMQITRGRTERKMKEKMLVTSEEGLVKLAKKRQAKILKKKQKHKAKVLINQLTR